MSWFLLMPYWVNGPTLINGEKIAVTLPDISTGWIGAKGIFTGIICVFASSGWL